MDEMDKLLQEQESLREKIHALRLTKKKDVIASIKLQMKNYGVVVEDLVESPTTETSNSSDEKKFKEAKKVEPKYFHPESGTYWSGRGRRPRVFMGKDDMTPYLIDKEKAEDMNYQVKMQNQEKEEVKNI